LGLAAFGVLALAASGRGQLVNGSFEDTNGFVNQGNDTMVLGIGSTTMTGWTVVNNQLAWLGPSNPFGLAPALDGSYFLDLTSYANSPPYGGVMQSVPTITGAHYDLSFGIGFSMPEDGLLLPAVQASATGNPSATFTVASSAVLTQGNGWQTFNYDFTAVSPQTSIELAGATTGQFIYLGLDDVNLTETSGPSGVPDAASTCGLLTLGLAALARFGNRRTRV
jgi:hypothetical protein